MFDTRLFGCPCVFLSNDPPYIFEEDEEVLDQALKNDWIAVFLEVFYNNGFEECFGV